MIFEYGHTLEDFTQLTVASPVGGSLGMAKLSFVENSRYT